MRVCPGSRDRRADMVRAQRIVYNNRFVLGTLSTWPWLAPALMLPTVGGTSAAAPTFASIITLLNDVRLWRGGRPLGFLNPWLYTVGRLGLNDITIGSSAGCNTTGFPARRGWDASVVDPPQSDVMKLISRAPPQSDRPRHARLQQVEQARLRQRDGVVRGSPCSNLMRKGRALRVPNVEAGRDPSSGARVPIRRPLPKGPKAGHGSEKPLTSRRRQGPA